MSDVFDYLDWRGDLSFKESPFNEADNIVFTLLTYIKFTGVVSDSFKESVTIEEAAKADYSLHKVPDPRLYALLERCASSRRFRNVRLTGYSDLFKIEEDCQFCAITFLFDSGYAYVSFRGTDSSVTGLKEDFNMSYKAPIPSQAHGVKYLVRLLKELSWWNRRRQLMLGGHSKGGNVAQYTAIHSPKKAQKHIHVIWSNDGPGFNEEFFPKNWSLPFVSRMKTFLPADSIIGRLFEHQEICTLITSSEKGTGSHDPFTWNIQGTSLVRTMKDSPQTDTLDRSFRDWLMNVSLQERAELTEAIFEVLEEMGIQSLYDFRTFKLSQALAGIKKLTRLDEAQRKALTHGIKQFNTSYKLSQDSER